MVSYWQDVTQPNPFKNEQAWRTGRALSGPVVTQLSTATEHGQLQDFGLYVLLFAVTKGLQPVAKINVLTSVAKLHLQSKTLIRGAFVLGPWKANL